MTKIMLPAALVARCCLSHRGAPCLFAMFVISDGTLIKVSSWALNNQCGAISGDMSAIGRSVVPPVWDASPNEQAGRR